MFSTCESNVVEGDFIEGNYGVKSLLCLATSVREDGSPIRSADSLRRHLPIRILATIKYIEEEGTKFVISFNNDPRDDRDFKWKMNAFYADPDNRQEVQMESAEIGSTYVCRHYGNNFERCRLEAKDGNIYKVYLVDTAEYAAIKLEELFYIATSFHGNELDYGFVLCCNTPTADFLEALKLPTLKEFRVKEVVEVIVCSLVEPCLAVLGSTTKHFARIRPETVILGLSGDDIQTWQINFLDSEPSLNGVISGQYPPVQPVLFSAFSLVTVAAYASLDKVYVRDILSSIRLSYLQEIINDFYGATKFREQMQLSDRAEPVPNLPCVVYDELSAQYVRAKILRLSGDCSIVDIAAVDYPNIVIKGKSLDSLYLLSDRFNLQPQCFPVRLVDIEDPELLFHYSNLAKHFLPIGSVISAASHIKDTLVTLKCADDADVLHKIGYLSKEDGVSDQLANSLVFDSSSTSLHKRIDAVESAVRRLDAVPMNSSCVSVLASEKLSFAPSASQQGVFSFSGSQSLQKPSILKKSSYEKPKTNMPIGSIAALVSYIKGPDAIFLRNAELSESYAKLSEKFDKMDSKQNWLKEHVVKVGAIYMLKNLQGSWQRIYILNRNSTGSTTYLDVDTGETCSELLGQICKADKEIAEWRKPLVQAFSLSTNIESKYRSSDVAVAELRKLLPGDEKVYYYYQIEQDDDPPAAALDLRSKKCLDQFEMLKPKEVQLFKSDGSIVNDTFDQIVKKIEKEEEGQKIAWD